MVRTHNRQPVDFLQPGIRNCCLILILILSITGCSPAGLVNGLSPDSHYRLTSDVAYGKDDRQKLDIYSPRSANGLSPLILFYYGGGWRNGNKEEYGFVASSLTKAGYMVIIPDYRLYPEVVFPAFIEDGAAALAWALGNADKYGADTSDVFLMGHSAGAHLAAMLALNEQYLARHAISPGRLKGLVGLSGPYDFLPLEQGYLRSVFPEDSRIASQPINFVTANAPPTLLIHGTGDRRVDPSNSTRLAGRLSDLGVEVTLKLYEGAGHAEIVASLAPPLQFTNNTLEDIQRFLANH